jgi:MHS family dicarboxylic acid transporter PcaT-like MFS transporter/MHS family alpha-ketoglutarate permease-like MFS transporter
MLFFGGLATLCVLPIMHALKDISSPYAAFGLIIIALAIISFYTSISGLIKAEMFPVEVRALGVGLSYAVANAMFGGSAEYVALQFKAWHVEEYFYWYVTIMCLISFIVAIRMPDPSRSGLLK